MLNDILLTVRTKTFFITDAHLGSGTDSRQRETDLVRWLDSIAPEAKRLVMLGDIFDFWFSYRDVVPRGCVRFLGKLAELADAGVELHFFIGNHDMWLFDYLQQEVGAIMHNEPATMEWEGNLFLLGHGDGLGNQDRSYNFIKFLFRNRLCQWLFAGVHPRIAFGIARRWSEASRRSHSVKYKGYLGDDLEGIVCYCQQRQRERLAEGLRPYNFFLFGHRHTPVTRPLITTAANSTASATYINVGNWIENRDYAFFDGQTVHLVEFSSHGV